MSWSWRIGRVAGINIYMHWTFLLLLAFIGFLYAAQGSSWVGAAIGIGFVLAVFGCVVLHELGHALTALQFGVSTKDITLLPIGGVARLQRMPEHPGQELLVAVAGPLVNVVIAGVLAVVLWATGDLRTATPTSITEIARGNFLANLMWVNGLLVAFNLLPAFPMDGGRVLRALLAMWLDYGTATAIAARIGQMMAILFGLVGLLASNPFLLFIALFVYLGAAAEAQQTEIRTLLSNVSVREAMLSRFQTLAPGDTLGTAADELLAGSQQDFPVVEEDRYLGMLQRKDLVRGIQEHGREAAVGELMTPDCATADLDDGLDAVMRRMNEQQCSTVPVFHLDRLVGVLTLENVGEFMMLRSALKNGHHRQDRTSPPHSSRAGTGALPRDLLEQSPGR
jgi:Zn-dependent protease/CBS domain-containing protein